jgi:hypothetical protein
LARDYDSKTTHVEAMIQVGMIRLMAVRLSDEEIKPRGPARCCTRGHERRQREQGRKCSGRGARSRRLAIDRSWRLAARLRLGRTSVMHGAADSRVTRCG